MMLFIVLDGVVFNLWICEISEFCLVTIQMKYGGQYFPLVSFIILKKLIIALESLGKSSRCVEWKQ